MLPYLGALSAHSDMQFSQQQREATSTAEGLQGGSLGTCTESLDKRAASPAPAHGQQLSGLQDSDARCPARVAKARHPETAIRPQPLCGPGPQGQNYRGTPSVSGGWQVFSSPGLHLNKEKAALCALLAEGLQLFMKPGEIQSAGACLRPD